MKTLLPALLIAIACCCFTKAEAQLLRFYYYPKNNVYYDVANKEYIYQHEGNWTPVTTLPSDMAVLGTSRVVVYSMKPDVWQMNEDHQEHFKNYTAGRFRKLFNFRKEDEDTEQKR